MASAAQGEFDIAGDADALPERAAASAPSPAAEGDPDSSGAKRGRDGNASPAASSSSSTSIKKSTGLRRYNGDVIAADGRVVDADGVPLFLQPRAIVEELTAQDPASAKFMTRHRFYLQRLGGKAVWCNLCGKEVQGSADRRTGAVSFGPVERHFKEGHVEWYRPQRVNVAALLAAGPSAAGGGAAEAETDVVPDDGASMALAQAPPATDREIFSKLKHLMAMFVIIDGEALNTPTHLGVRNLVLELVKLFKPNYELGVPTRYHITNEAETICTTFWASLKLKFEAASKTGFEWLKPRFGCMFDMWKDAAKRHVLGVAVTMIDVEGNWVEEAAQGAAAASLGGGALAALHLGLIGRGRAPLLQVRNRTRPAPQPPRRRQGGQLPLHRLQHGAHVEARWRADRGRDRAQRLRARRVGCISAVSVYHGVGREVYTVSPLARRRRRRVHAVSPRRLIR